LLTSAVLRMVATTLSMNLSSNTCCGARPPGTGASGSPAASTFPELATAQILVSMWNAVGVRIDLQIVETFGQMLTYRTAWRLDNGTAARHEPYMAKLYCTELGFEAADRCLQFHGAMGLSKEMPIEQMWRRSRSYMITGGPAEIMRTVISRHVYKLF
jgi:alkylation response protein AidB-like acyl-CoA dehydrogenase